MAKLSALTDELARLTGLPKGTVQQTARHLREAGLIASGGRGPGGAEMTFSDARNLLIGLAASQQVKDAPGIVSMLDRATANNRTHSEDGGERFPAEPVEINGEDLSANPFGTALDGLLALMADGDVTDRFTGQAFDVSLIFPRTDGAINARASIRIESSDKRWEWDFHANNPDFDTAPSDRWGKMAKSRLAGVESVDFEQLTRVGPMILFALADFIGGPKE